MFYQVCRWVLKYRTTKNPLIQMTILNLLPRLAAFQPNTFAGVFLLSSIIISLTLIHKSSIATGTNVLHFNLNIS